MTTSELRLVRAFTRDGRGGNPAGVVLEADGLDAAQRQAIAAHSGASETAFLSRSDTATRRVEFFTPTRRIAHCGHATVAAFGLLRHLGVLADGDYIKESVDGPRAIRIRDGKVFLRLPSPNLPGVAFDAPSLARLLQLPATRIDAGASGIVDLGNRFLHVRVVDAGALRAIRPDLAAISALSEQHDLIGLYAYTHDTDWPAHTARARMFAPRYGIDEEAATGMAAAGLAAWLAARAELPGDRGWIEQGDTMPTPSPSLLEVRIERLGADIAAIRVGGEIGTD